MYLRARKNHFSTSQFRKTLSARLSDTKPSTIGSAWELRAILIPWPKPDHPFGLPNHTTTAKLKHDTLLLIDELASL
jgi:hypothetical protein